MDLSMRQQIAEEFEYRHKKFGQVRSSPVTLEPNSFEDARSTISTPHSSINSSSTRRNSLKRTLRDDDTTWEPSSDELDLLPRTPTKRQRMQSRTSRNKRTAANELCNAPKKRKSGHYDARAQTPPPPPQKSMEFMPTTTANLMPQISKDTLARICQYNKNMVRKFPQKERSLKDQERRDKNTIACRMSRRLKKLETLAVEEQHKIFIQEYLEQSKQAMHAAVYLNELLKFGAIVPAPENNTEIIASLADKLNLHHLREVSPTQAIKQKRIQSESTENVHLLEKRSIENQLNGQEKRSFSIAYLLGTR